MTLKKSAADLSNAQRAEAVFKPASAGTKPLNEQQIEEKAFGENRERLKAERLAREAAAPAAKK